MNIQSSETESGGRYFVDTDKGIAEMTFSKAGETRINIDHTGGPDAMRGQGYGEALVLRGCRRCACSGQDDHPTLPLRGRAVSPASRGMGGRSLEIDLSR